jgi:hypothetical protein
VTWSKISYNKRKLRLNIKADPADHKRTIEKTKAKRLEISRLKDAEHEIKTCKT